MIAKVVFYSESDVLIVQLEVWKNRESAPVELSAGDYQYTGSTQRYRFQDNIEFIQENIAK